MLLDVAECGKYGIFQPSLVVLIERYKQQQIAMRKFQKHKAVYCNLSYWVGNTPHFAAIWRKVGRVKKYYTFRIWSKEGNGNEERKH